MLRSQEFFIEIRVRFTKQRSGFPMILIKFHWLTSALKRGLDQYPVPTRWLRVLTGVRVALLISLIALIGQSVWGIWQNIRDFGSDDVVPPPAMARKPQESITAQAALIKPIIAAHLFGVPTKPAVEAQAVQKTAPSVQTHLEVSGIIASRDQGSARAIVSVNGKQHVYRIHAMLPNRMRILTIHPTAIVVQDGQETKTLRLPHANFGFASTALATARFASTRSPPAEAQQMITALNGENATPKPSNQNKTQNESGTLRAGSITLQRLNQLRVRVLSQNPQ
jgi:type II secretory pathway component PulC